MVVLFIALALELIFRKRKKSDFSQFISKKTEEQKKLFFVFQVFMPDFLFIFLILKKRGFYILFLIPTLFYFFIFLNVQR